MSYFQHALFCLHIKVMLRKLLCCRSLLATGKTGNLQKQSPSGLHKRESLQVKKDGEKWQAWQSVAAAAEG
jgi:hypothetical protein